MSERSRNKRPPTMNDVASLAKVSQTTVSLVLNNVPDARISEETRKRVQNAVKKLGYRPNVMAQGLKTSRSRVIGFITDQIATSPHAGQIFQGALYVAHAHKKIIYLVNIGCDQAMEEEAIEAMLERQVEGIIYATMYHRPVEPPDIIREVPTVLLDCFCEDRSLPSIVPDEVGGGRAATEALLKAGHRRIGFINNRDPIPATFGRLEGYKQALKRYGVPLDESLICYDESEARGGYRSALALLSRDDRPTALFCFNDRAAMGAYDAIRKLGLRIPDDVAVVGFDNHEIIADRLHPGLSTVQLPHHEMGQWAVKYLLERDDSGSLPSVQEMAKCEYVKRDSI